jgi:hypothetical protein
MAEGFYWQKPDLDEATLREMRHFRILGDCLYQQRGIRNGLTTRRSENTAEYTIVYVNTIMGETYKVTDTTFERLD